MKELQTAINNLETFLGFLGERSWLEDRLNGLLRVLENTINARASFESLGMDTVFDAFVTACHENIEEWWEGVKHKAEREGSSLTVPPLKVRELAQAEEAKAREHAQAISKLQTQVRNVVQEYSQYKFWMSEEDYLRGGDMPKTREGAIAEGAREHFAERNSKQAKKDRQKAFKAAKRKVHELVLKFPDLKEQEKLLQTDSEQIVIDILTARP